MKAKFLLIATAFLTLTVAGYWYYSRSAAYDPRITFYPSPHFDSRPEGTAIDTIVLHATERNSAEEVIIYFSYPLSKVSAHFTIDRDGTLYEHVRPEMRAWHAGVSRMPDGREHVNDFSIGIELVNLNDGKDPYPKAQLDALCWLLGRLREDFGYKFVVKHSEIAMPPGRKSDPAGFDHHCE